MSSSERTKARGVSRRSHAAVTCALCCSMRQAALVLLLLLVVRSSAGPLRAGPAPCPCNIRPGSLQAMVAGELARHRHELFMVEGDVAGLAALHVDARPDDMAVLARDALPVLLDVEHDRARLAGQPEALFRRGRCNRDIAPW